MYVLNVIGGLNNTMKCKKNPADGSKSLPPPTVGAPSASNSPSALSARALRAGALRARARKNQPYILANL